MTALYDPLTYENLMLGVVLHFEGQDQHRLAGVRGQDIDGPGIYALFYTGPFAPYRPISGGNTPIYVGKAVPPGSRKGVPPDPNVPALRRRLAEHGRSIVPTDNLNLGDFAFRALAIEPVWITVAERFLIDHYRPLWNVCVDGFGDHDPGSGRYRGERSWWDTLHPGRNWASRLRGVKTPTEATDLVNEFFVPHN
jgi:hypothetical protein